MEKGYVRSLDDMKAYYCEYYCEWLEANRKDGISNLRSKEEALIRILLLADTLRCIYPDFADVESQWNNEAIDEFYKGLPK